MKLTKGKAFLILLTGMLWCIAGAAQQSINDYKYIIVPHFYEFTQSKDQYRLNTITRYLFRQRGFNALMRDEIAEDDYKNNPCLALNADVKNNSNMLRTKLVIVLTNCDGEVIFQSEVGDSKLKEYDEAYKEALMEAFESFDAVSYNYSPNENILKRGQAESNREEVEALKEEIDSLKSQPSTGPKPKVSPPIAPAIDTLALEEPKEIQMVEPEVERKPNLPEKAVNDNKLRFYAVALDRGYALKSKADGPTDFVILPSSIDGVFTIQGKSGLVINRNGAWILEETVDGEQRQSTLDLIFQ